MKSSAAVVAAVAVVAALLSHGANAADAAAPPAMPAAPAPMPAASMAAASVPASADAERPRAGEPNVRLTVIDDGRARIEELRVRGQLQKVTVSPKGNAPGYEVLLGDGVHMFADDPGTSRGSAGKRVWNVLRF